MQPKKKYLAVIVARKHSKRLPGKNLRLLNDKTLVAHSIDFALRNQQLFEQIIVSSDDEEVLKIALQKSVLPLRRPAELATDTANSVSVLKHALERVKKPVDAVVLLQPTNPFRKKNLIEQAIGLYESSSSESLLTVSPLRKKFGKIVQNRYQPSNYQIGQRSQDLEPLYFENGLLYITSAECVKQNKMLDNSPAVLLTDYLEAEIDIDTLEDFQMAEYFAQNFKE